MYVAIAKYVTHNNAFVRLLLFSKLKYLLADKIKNNIPILSFVIHTAEDLKYGDKKTIKDKKNR
tara:strand:+ start:401 stop:592 length:192 start_codon:yes stop_codon:yes gene_type:complete